MIYLCEFIKGAAWAFLGFAMLVYFKDFPLVFVLAFFIVGLVFYLLSSYILDNFVEKD